MRVILTIDEILKGAKKKLKYKRQVSCNTCSGKGGTDIRSCGSCNGSGRRVVVQNTTFGQMRQEIRCSDCRGTGKTINNMCGSCHGDGTNLKEEVVEVEIPAGLSNGMQLNMHGYGNHTRDGVPGDLHIIIEEQKEFYFKRERNNLIVDKEISIIDSILGANLNVKTPHGEIPITIESGTEHGRNIRISGLGVPDVSLGLGDLYVVVKIKIPKLITDEEKSILEKLKDSKNFEV
jgi:molecular chaperone DnaJ